MSNFDSITFHGSITIVPRITIQFPAKWDAVRYFSRNANLANETDRDLETEMRWDHTQTYLLPVNNDFCIRKLAKALLQTFEDEVHGDAHVLRVELYDPKTHTLIAAADAA